MEEAILKWIIPDWFYLCVTSEGTVRPFTFRGNGLRNIKHVREEWKGRQTVNAHSETQHPFIILLSLWTEYWGKTSESSQNRELSGGIWPAVKVCCLLVSFCFSSSFSPSCILSTVIVWRRRESERAELERLLHCWATGNRGHVRELLTCRSSSKWADVADSLQSLALHL